MWEHEMRSQSPIQATLPSSKLGWRVMIFIVFLLPDRKRRIGRKRVDVEMLKHKICQKFYFSLAGKLKLVFNIRKKSMTIVCHLCWHFPNISNRLLSQINSGMYSQPNISFVRLFYTSPKTPGKKLFALYL